MHHNDKEKKQHVASQGGKMGDYQESAHDFEESESEACVETEMWSYLLLKSVMTFRRCSGNVIKLSWYFYFIMGQLQIPVI